ncbi:hypothetical protein F2P81_008202 [Scophthalmus maximus]|uniref:Uncharacterized protein n=1 Tax=Scophthalmus maximus TaxID=52904 RepID=A0A6A4T1N2_SCOMX|nr:hypothetical protein F2P81_008202 [Scophthalmus maximus]
MFIATTSPRVADASCQRLGLVPHWWRQVTAGPPVSFDRAVSKLMLRFLPLRHATFCLRTFPLYEPQQLNVLSSSLVSLLNVRCVHGFIETAQVRESAV